jgi:hypothetical protein
MTNIKTSKSTIVGIAALTLALAFGGAVYASHSFEAGVTTGNIPDNTHVNLNGLTLPPGGVLPVYDSSPNIVSGHFLYRGPCDAVVNEEHGFTSMVPKVTAIAGHIDEENDNTHVDKIPLYYIAAASTAGSCVWHGHVPDPLNGGSPLVTDIALINLSGADVTFNPGDVVDVNIQRVLGEVGTSYVGNTLMPADLGHGNPVFDLNDESHDNDGAGHHED